ncbi:MAG TPA: SMP-30/gluconolactonase/LRE family protein [Thermodesulfobacteriota bacterium]|nr:SMP-30/gluconolactonase/LRE family protein [Thermodesulfobacteriota bacterium]
MKKWKVILGLCVLGVLLLGGFGVKTFYNAGEFKEVSSHFQGQCQPVSGVLSSEDITIHPQSGMAFISSDDRRPWFHGHPGKQGAIMGYDLKDRNKGLINLTRDFSREFHPHGIGLYIGPDGKSKLFVVNHTQKGHFVEIFDYEPGRLIHRESIHSTLMHSPNDVLAVGPRSFYVTNDHGNTSSWGKKMEEFLQLFQSYVLYFDGQSFRKVAESLAYANGVNASPDGKTVYVAETVGRRIDIFDRHVDSGALKFKNRIELGTAPDNIELDEKGALWIGAHPKLLTFVKYSKDPTVPSPSQVLKVTVGANGNHKTEEIYLNSGRPLSGSSAAAVFGQTLLIGSVFDDRFMVCQMPGSQPIR